MDIKSEIQQTFIQLVLENADKISVNLICSRMNISRKTFYKYYRDKLEIIEDIVHSDYSTLDTLTHIENRAKEDSVIILDSLYSKLYSHRHLYKKLYLLDGEYRYFLQCIYRENYEMNRRVLPATVKNYKNNTEAEYHLHLAALSGVNLVEKWIQDDFSVPPRGISEIFYKYVVSSWY